MEPWQAPASEDQPPADHTPRPLSGDLKGAGFGPRAVARVIDMVVHLAIGLVAGILGAIVLTVLAVAGAVRPDWAEHMSEFSLLGMVGGFASSVLYHSVAESLHGATLGKLLVGLHKFGLSQEYGMV